MAPTISVVMGNYNHAQYLPEALAPFLELERFFCEIIVADDASTDNSLEILEEYAARCPRMRIIKNPKNLGCIGNFTMLLREAKGDFVIGAAADDKMLPEHLETLLTAIQKYPDAALFAGRNLYYFEELRATFPTRKYTMKTGLHDAGDFRFVKGGLPIGPAGTFLRRDLFLKYYEQCSQMGPCADGVVSCMVIARHPFYFLNEPVAVVRVTSSNYSGKTSEKEFQDHFYPQFFDLLETEYPDLYAMMTECRGFQHFLQECLRNLFARKSPIAAPGFEQQHQLFRTRQIGYSKGMHPAGRKGRMNDSILRANRHAMTAEDARRFVLRPDATALLVKNLSQANLHAALATDTQAAVYLQVPDGQCLLHHVFV